MSNPASSQATQAPKFDEIMDFATYNEGDFADLSYLIKTNKVIPFVGAGMSAFHFPLWKEYLSSQFSRHLSGQTMPQDLMDAASVLKAALEENDFLRDIVRKFGGTRDTDWKEVQEKAQNEAVALLPKLFADLVVTTNYDRVLEHVYGTPTVTHPGHFEQLNAATLGTNGSTLIFKVHGSVEESKSIIITREDYDDNYISGSALDMSLKKVFSTRILLFLGCSLGQDDTKDKTIELWKELSNTDSATGIEHFAIVGCKPGEQAAKRRELSKRNIRAILYDKSKGHGAVRTLLLQCLASSSRLA